MKVNIGCFYKHTPTGTVVKVSNISDDGDIICFDNGHFVTKEIFDQYYEEFTNNDRVNHPSYYQDPSGVECIDVVRHRDFDIGSAMKYLWRAGLKKEMGLTDIDKEIEDLKKAKFYIDDKINMLTKQKFSLDNNKSKIVKANK